MFLEKPTQDTLHPSTSHDKVQYQPQPARAMATDFAMPVQQFTASPSQSQYTLYNSQSQPISPINSASATPKNASPTSPRTTLPPHLAAHTRQLRPPKSPLYVPAVLRPTDPPKRISRPSPLTPPQSMHGSFDELENARTLNRRSTGDSGKFGLGAITEAEFSSEGLGKVTALPTREHGENLLIVCRYSRIPNPPYATSRPALDTSPTSGGDITVGVVEISFARHTPRTPFLLTRMPITILGVAATVHASTAGPNIAAGKWHVQAAQTARVLKTTRKHPPPQLSSAPETVPKARWAVFLGRAKACLKAWELASLEIGTGAHSEWFYHGR